VEDFVEDNDDNRATTSAPSAAIGALSQGLRVISILVRMRPKPPNAVTKVAMLVGLNGENPGMPLRRVRNPDDLRAYRRALRARLRHRQKTR
jgi:hypothetical protein